MKKLIQVLKKEEIPQIMGMTFLIMAAVTLLAVQVAPLQLSKEARVQYYAHNPNGGWEWLFALTIPTIIALLIGVCATLWKLRWPSND